MLCASTPARLLLGTPIDEIRLGQLTLRAAGIEGGLELLGGVALPLLVVLAVPLVHSGQHLAQTGERRHETGVVLGPAAGLDAAQ
ncbi:hypothetical protein BU52_28510 [Streptomyces toyocaensis]|uniref:Uncharacterized protein n=1 Tax=Streptomyces toyocaensis TaxID=55952 RepID=A0A081XJQ9_STRTO|nr:hypothetical protein BU52_28510 [Streptomyces toyocaensis]